MAIASMQKYSVLVTRDITESIVIEVTADTVEQAENKALEKLSDAPSPIWQVDDGSGDQSDPYVTATDPVSENE